MRNMKKFLALSLTVATIASAAGVPVLAAEEVDATQNVAVEAIAEEAEAGETEAAGDVQETADLEETEEVAEEAEAETVTEEVETEEVVTEEAADETQEASQEAQVETVEKEESEGGVEAYFDSKYFSGRWEGSGSSRRFYNVTDKKYLNHGVYTIAGKPYFFSGGYVKYGWIYDNEKYYHSNTAGVLDKGWTNLGGTYYFFDNDYSMICNGFYDIDGATYGFTSGGAMIKGWYQASGYWYYFASGGKLQTGWVHVGTQWYYANASYGYLYTNTKMTIDGKVYRFNENGAMVRGWYKVGTKYEYYNRNGIQQKNAWVQYTDGNWYFVGSNGYMLANTTLRYNGKTYRFNSKGICLNP